jgi:hypothetical protein
MTNSRLTKPRDPPKKRPDTSPKTCRCDGALIERDDLFGVVCTKCGRRKAAAK